MEAIVGMLASGTACASTAPSPAAARATRQQAAAEQQSAWHVWLEQLLRKELGNASLEKGKMWAFAAAQGCRAVSWDAAGLSSGRLADDLIDGDAARATRDAVAAWITARVGEYTGVSLAEGKLLMLLAQALESTYTVRVCADAFSPFLCSS